MVSAEVCFKQKELHFIKQNAWVIANYYMNDLL